MKQKILTMFILLGLTVSMLAGCGQAENISTANTQTVESTEKQEVAEDTTATSTVAAEPTEESHTHNYTEAIATEASCETEGLKTFTCECGDAYIEPISAIGHIFEKYVSNEDATYLADGTETATCVCGLTDTRTAEGSKLEYTYTDMEVTMYAQRSVNVRDLPSTDGNKVGSLSTNDEVKVTGQADTGWYRIEYNGGVAYVSNNYLGENKVEVKQASSSSSSSKGMSRKASDYRSIGDLSELSPGAGWDTDWAGFCASYKNIEKVTYTYNGVTVLLYDYTWDDGFGPQFIFYDFTRENTTSPWRRNRTADLHSIIDAGGYSSSSGFHPISDYQVY